MIGDSVKTVIDHHIIHIIISPSGPEVFIGEGSETRCGVIIIETTGGISRIIIHIVGAAIAIHVSGASAAAAYNNRNDSRSAK